MAYSPDDKRPARIFISHSNEDKEFAKALITLLEAMGGDAKISILCTSESGLGVKVGRDWVDELKRCFTDYRTYVIFIHSSHLYSSPVSMNEMGAAWVADCPVFSFLVNGFMEGSMAGVFTSNHQGVLVGRKDIAPDLDQLKAEVCELFGIASPDEGNWTPVRNDFIKTITALPADKGVIKEQFDVNMSEHIHISEYQLFDEDVNNDEKDITWREILIAVDSSLRTPHIEESIHESLKEAFPGIIEDDVKAITDKLHHYGLAEVRTVTSEYEGIGVAWSYTEEGRNAYERAKNYHLQVIFQERDKAQVIELLSNFSTYAMDDFLREGPDYISDELLISTDVWKGIVGGSAFQILNPSLDDVLKSFCELLFLMTGHGECYESVNNGKYKLYQPGYGFVNKQNEKTIKWLYENMPELRKRYDLFIAFIKKHYPDINLKETSERFEKECR